MEPESRGPRGGQPYPQQTGGFELCRRPRRCAAHVDGTIVARWTAISRRHRELQVDSGLRIRWPFVSPGSLTTLPTHVQAPVTHAWASLTRCRSKRREEPLPITRYELSPRRS